MFSFVRKLFQSSCTILLSHQQWIKLPVGPHPLLYLVLVTLWIFAILISVSSHCHFSLWFPNNIWHWASFNLLICHLYLLWWVVCLFLKLNFILFFLYFKVLDINSLSEMQFSNIYSGLVIWLFLLLMQYFWLASFTRQSCYETQPWSCIYQEFIHFLLESGISII